MQNTNISSKCKI